MKPRFELQDGVSLMLMRGLGIISFLVIPPFRYLLTPDSVDPMWVRFSFSLAALVVVIASYASSWVRRHIMWFAHSYALLMVTWMLGLSLANRLDPTYVTSFFILLFSTIVMIREWRWIASFLVVNAIVPVVAAFWITDPMFPVATFLVMTGSILVIGPVGYWSSLVELRAATERGNELKSLGATALETSNEGILVTGAAGAVRRHNNIFLRLFGWEQDSIEELPLGQWMSHLQQRMAAPEMVAQWVQAADKANDVEIVTHFQLTDGKYIRLLSKPLVNDSERFGRIWFFKDVTAAELRKVAMLDREAQLRRQNEILLSLSGEAGLQSGDFSVLAARLTKPVASAVEADRVGFWQQLAAGDGWSCESDYESRLGLARRGGTLQAAAHPDLFRSLHAERFVLFQGSLQHMAEGQGGASGFASLIVPLRLRGKLYGFITAERKAGPDGFSTEDQQFLASIGDLVAIALESGERLKAEQSLAKSAAILKSVFELAGVGILITSTDRKVIDLNNTYLAMFRLKEQFAREGDAAEVIAFCQEQLQEERASDSIRFILSNPTENHFERLFFKDGRILERFTEMLEVDGRLAGRVWYYRDETKRLRAEERLVASEMRNQAIIDAIPDLMLRIDEQGRILDRKMPVGWELAGALGSIHADHLGDLVPDDIAAEMLAQARATLADGQARETEGELQLLGNTRFFETRYAPSGPGEVLLMLRDVTARRKTERELVQRNHELDSFVYRASHDLKAPLNSLMGLIEIMRAETMDAAQTRYLQLMDRSVLKLDTFIRNLTEFSRISRSTIHGQVVDFAQLLEEVFEGMRYMQNADRVERRLHVAPGPPFIGDSFHLSIVLGNLLSNALKYCDLRKEASFVEVSVEATAADCLITVADNGVGIAGQHQARIFELFFRATNQSFGSGLGLYITRNAIEKMGGTIQMRSQEGEGTTFTIRLPNMPHEQPSQDAAHSAMAEPNS